MSFNPRPRARGDPCALSDGRHRCMFQSTPPRKGRPTACRSDTRQERVGFNPRPRTRGDVDRHAASDRVHTCFNPRPRARGDLSASIRCQLSMTGFNPRPRARGDGWPAAGSRLFGRFNPRPRARGDRRDLPESARCQAFQSTPPREGRRVARAGARIDVQVSIHAPARGATARALRWRSTRSRFNPRPRARGDHSSSAIARRYRQFQSTPPREGRLPMTIRFSRDAKEFQSTPPREGRPASRHRRRPMRCVSIHAPARGATAQPSDRAHAIACVSIHAPARGAT